MIDTERVPQGENVDGFMVQIRDCTYDDNKVYELVCDCTKTMGFWTIEVKEGWHTLFLCAARPPEEE